MIRFENVRFAYKKSRPVFDGLSFELGEGKICGLLGSNGAGKSTMLYLMSGLLRAGGGLIEVDGMKVSERKAAMLSRMFLVPEEFDLPSVSLENYLNMIKMFYPLFSDELFKKCLDGFELDPYLNLGSLSMGQKKKVFICVALAANTKYLLMDEPTNGLDIVGKSQFRKVVVSGMTDEKTVLISTHQVYDVERLLDHLVVIDHSRILYNKPLEENDENALNLEKMYLEIVGKSKEI
ncbi:MAG: ATP-binding cassette domain-containing protein [Bacteroidaceae bacterium]